MRSVRLDPELDEAVRRAAVAEGVTISEFIREAVTERTRRTQSHRPSELLADVIGSVHGGGGQARRTGDAFAELLEDRARKR